MATSREPCSIDPVLSVQPDHCYKNLAIQNTWKYCFINYHNIIHVSVSWQITQTPKHRRSSCYFIIKTYWFTNQVTYNTATVILNNKRNFNGFLAGLARWFQPHPIQQRLKIPPLKFSQPQLWCDFALQILRNKRYWLNLVYMGLENNGNCRLYGFKFEMLKRNSRSREKRRKLAQQERNILVNDSKNWIHEQL